MRTLQKLFKNSVVNWEKLFGQNIPKVSSIIPKIFSKLFLNSSEFPPKCFFDFLKIFHIFQGLVKNTQSSCKYCPKMVQRESGNSVENSVTTV